MLTYFSLRCCHSLYRFLFRFITSSTIFWVFARFSDCLLSSSSCSPMVLVRSSITNLWAAWKGTASHAVPKQSFLNDYDFDWEDISNTRDSVSSAIFVKNTPLRIRCSTLFSVFGHPDETLSLVFHILLPYLGSRVLCQRSEDLYKVQVQYL